MKNWKISDHAHDRLQGRSIPSPIGLQLSKANDRILRLCKATCKMAFDATMTYFFHQDKGVTYIYVASLKSGFPLLITAFRFGLKRVAI